LKSGVGLRCGVGGTQCVGVGENGGGCGVATGVGNWIEAGELSSVASNGAMVLCVLQNCQGLCGYFPSVKSLIRVSGTKLGIVARGCNVAVEAVVMPAACLAVAHLVT